LPGIAVAVLAFLTLSCPAVAEETNAGRLDLNHPDAIIKTTSLAKLPRDLLRIPLLKDLLTEDFLFYYEQNEGRLSLNGTLRRIAYEHDLDIGDWVIRTVIDEPAEVLLWKGRNNRLEHGLISMSRNFLARLVEMAARIALNDKQLRKVDETLVVEGEDVPVYALTYAYRRTLYFASRGDRMVILSDAELLKDKEGKIRDDTRTVLVALLSKDARMHGLYGDRFKLSGDGSNHTIALTARYLSFGYQHFFPAMQGLRFDFGRAGWSTWAMFNPKLLSGEALDTELLWRMAPSGSSVCVALPVDWNATSKLFSKFGVGEKEMERILKSVQGPAAVCWYPKSHLHTPLFLVPVKKPIGPAERALLKKVFETVIGTRESSLETQEDGRYPVTVASHTDGTDLIQRPVTSPYGLRKSEPGETKGISGRYFKVTLAQHKQALFFSPDDQLIDNALAVADKKFPAVGDTLSRAVKTGSVIAAVSPRSLGALLEAETLESLQPGKQPVMRGVAMERLLPRLAALKKYPDFVLVLPADMKQRPGEWVPVVWQAVE
jgi:uncharacterized protein YfaA (DUF2138 family)